MNKDDYELVGEEDGHVWIIHRMFKKKGWITCKRCGIIKRATGKNKPCKGTVRITTRSNPSIPSSL